MTAYRLAIPATGAPAMSGSHGSLGWSTATLLVGDAGAVVIDTGGPGYRAMWDAWLAAEGLTRFDVSLVLATHCHWDHVGAVDWFPNARVAVGAAELEWAERAAGADPFLSPALVRAVLESERLERLGDSDEIDGIRVVPTPGHTPGHLSYAADTDRGTVLIVGDAVKNGDELSTGRFAMSMDRTASENSRQRILRAATDDGMFLLLGHDGLYSPGLERLPAPVPTVSVFAGGTIVQDAPAQDAPSQDAPSQDAP